MKKGIDIMKIKTRKEMQLREVEINTYIADDGTMFDDFNKCENYENQLKISDLRKKLNQIQTCEDLRGCTPLDGGEYMEYHDYVWYLPKNQEECDIITEYYGLEYSVLDINEWVCVECCDSDYPKEDSWSMPLIDSIDHIKAFFDKLGYDVTISKR